MAKPIIALLYDFDKTLSPTDMQEYDFIKNLGMSPKEFWDECARLKLEKYLTFLREIKKGINNCIKNP